MNSENKTEPNYLRLIQPQLLIWVLLTYSIGVGLVHHQGGELDWVSILLGAILSILFIEIRVFLSAYFDHPASPTSELRKDDPNYLQLKNLDRQTLLVIALTVLTASAVNTALLVIRHALNFPAILILGIAYLLSFFTAVPPIRLEKRGYAEVSDAILICNLIPAIGYLLNMFDLHVLLIMLTLPLTLLYLSLRIVQSLETYGSDLTYRIQSIVVRLEWHKAMTVHNYLVLIAFLFIGVFALLGQPWSLTWPMLLPLVIGIFQIIQILSIISGAPPRWKILKLTAVSTFVVMAYLISFTLWIS